MKRVFVKDLSEGDDVDETFAVREVSIRVARNGSKYIQGRLSDRTGSVPIRQWDAKDETLNLYTGSGYVRVRGRAESYPPGSGRLQLVVRQARMLAANEVDPADFETATDCDPKELERELDSQIASVEHAKLRKLLEAILRDPEIREKLLTSPAATDYHHPFRGGLLEHTVAVTRSGLRIAETNPRLERDLLVAGCLLHDIGKIEEITGGAAPAYTEAGLLIGHISLATLLIERKIAEIGGIDERTRLSLLHIILSHHGVREFGSPVNPATPEALAVHHLDNLDAKVEASRRLIETDTGGDEFFTERSRMLGVRLYKRPPPGDAEK